METEILTALTIDPITYSAMIAMNTGLTTGKMNEMAAPAIRNTTNAGGMSCLNVVTALCLRFTNTFQ